MSSNSQPPTTDLNNNSEERRRRAGRTPRKEYAGPKKFTFDENQRALLEASFQRNRVLTPVETQQLVQASGAPESSIRNWFQTRRNKERRSLLLAADGDGPAANEASADQVAPAAEVQSATAPDPGHRQPFGMPAPNPIVSGSPATANVIVANAQETPQAGAVREWLRNHLQQQQQAVYQTPPFSMPPPPPPKAHGDDLVEVSGRAMMIRLRQLHEKDPKLFLQVENAIGNAIFKYEMEVDE